MRRLCSFVYVSLLLASPCIARGEAKAVKPEQIDAIFATYDTVNAPGCSVAVSWYGKVIHARAYGMADLEHDVPNTPATVFECGSVSKQFTAAAVVLLALDGKLKLDDDIRKYFPELPEYRDKITIRHLLNHTSGLRDWGVLAGLEGWPRGRRVHTHDHVLDILRRQKQLNHPPGHKYSYTNSGYNLLAMLVGRVSGKSFASFSKERIFVPLEMSRTQWRDDYRRIVKNRAIAYSWGFKGWQQEMPFENVHGNGGLLTTAADLVRFSHNLHTGKVGGPKFVKEMHRVAVLANGKTIHYASGLSVKKYKGLAEVSHSGATAGYRAFLARYPQHGLIVSLVGNASTLNATSLAHRVVDLYLKPEEQRAAAANNSRISKEELEQLSGGYRNRDTSQFRKFNLDGSSLRILSTKYRPDSAGSFRSPQGTMLRFKPRKEGEPRIAVLDASTRTEWEQVEAFAPTEGGLREYVGDYDSDEIPGTHGVRIEGGQLVLSLGVRRLTLRPVYPDAFSCTIGIVRFRRDDKRRVTEMSYHSSRVWDLRFAKRKESR